MAPNFSMKGRKAMSNTTNYARKNGVQIIGVYKDPTKSIFFSAKVWVVTAVATFAAGITAIIAMAH
jgi:hypothetical protein